MKVKLSVDELYPVYLKSDWTTGSGTEVEIDNTLWEKYLVAKGIFYELLDEVEEVVRRNAFRT